ncbi:ankyrin repeat domain-containing protein, partial [Methylicorpusculum sp.]|uniref:ankyrin repeat domain-containing protein n=1 Tax=Methylicorpusculum sp. TaxID=2713644 RepID=UPI002AB912E0
KEAKNIWGSTPLHQAITFDLIDMAQLLLDHGANLEATNNEGYTPLHIAAGEGNTKMAVFLRDKKANLEAKDKEGHTPLHLAALCGKTEMVRLLLGYDAKPDGIASTKTKIIRQEIILLLENAKRDLKTHSTVAVEAKNDNPVKKRRRFE